MEWLVVGLVALALSSSGSGSGDVPDPVGDPAMSDSTANSHVQALWDAAYRTLGGLTDQARALIVAHAVKESGWNGQGHAGRRGHGWWNITTGWKRPADGGISGWRSASGVEPWVEVGGDTDHGQVITQEWRQYASDEEAIADYWFFLGPTANGGRYATARGYLEQGDATAFAQALGAAGYYDTSTIPQYTADLASIHAAVSSQLGV